MDKCVNWDKLEEFSSEIASKWIIVGINLLPNEHRDMIRELIDEGEKTNEEKCTLVLKRWIELSSTDDCSWGKLCSVLRSHKVKMDDLAAKMEDSLTSNKPSHAYDLKESDKSHPVYQKIHSRLRRLAINEDGDMWSDETEWISKVRRVLDDFFKKCRETELDVANVEKWIEELYEKERYIPPALYSWAKDCTLKLGESRLLKSISEEPATEDSKPETPNPVKVPLFSKENQYHALLCCKLLQSSDITASLRKHGHVFDHFSVTKSECQKKHRDEEEFGHGTYIIAQKGDTYIVAFQGLQDIGEWKKYETLQNALVKQAGCIPCNYFAHLVESNNRVIFTGYSLGGTLACAVSTRMLQSNPLHEQLLRENVACITFGQPPISDSTFEALLTKQSFLSECFHFIYSDDCPVPLLLKYCLVSLDGKSKKSETGGPLAVAKANSDILLDTKEVLKEKMSQNTRKKTSHLVKDKVDMMNKNGIVKEAEPPLPQGNYYLFKDPGRESTSSDKEPVTLEFLPREKALTLFSRLDPSVVVAIQDTLIKHELDYYNRQLSLFWKHAPEYSIPSVRNGPPPCVEGVSPVVEQVEFHIYEHEVCILVSGTDLWFSRDLSFPKIKYMLHTRTLENADRLIQVHSKNKSKLLSLIDGYAREGVEQIKVTLGMCLDVTRHTRNVAFTVKDFEMSMRQAQLANLSDRQLIGVSLLSATLERRSNSKSVQGGKALYSKKYENIRSFLQKASAIVPVEGCLYALAEMIKLGQLFTDATPYAMLYMIPKLFELLLEFSRCGSLPPSKSMLNILDHILYDHMNVLPFAMARFMDPEDESKWVKIHKFLLQQGTEINESLKRMKNYQPIVSDVNIQKVLSSSAELDPQKQLDAMKQQLDAMVVSEASCERTSNADHPAPWDINQSMVQLANDVSNFSFFLGIVLDSFMSAQVQIPLSQNPQYTARALETTGVAVGVWYLIGLSFVDMKKIIQDRKLFIDVADYLGKYYGVDDLPTKNYVGKLNFICNAMSQRVSCSTQYISYSLERQLSKLCSDCGITSSTSTEEICSRWDEFFKEKILSLILPPYHPLIARWIQWTLAVYELRETLASYTTIGIIGLMNSGKSTLVNSLFGQKIPSGTMEAKRTTVPFLYNLEPEVEGIDVIDFPGVDDCNVDIQEHCKALFQLPQVIIFLVDYRKASSSASMAWLSFILNKHVPFLVCLTFGDKLFAECMPTRHSHLDPPDQSKPNDSSIHEQLQEHKKIFETKCSQQLLGGEEQLPFTVEICAFGLDKDSVLNEKENRRRLRNVGIKSTADVGEWIIESLQVKSQMKSAESLRRFFDTHSTSILN